MNIYNIKQPMINIEQSMINIKQQKILDELNNIVNQYNNNQEKIKQIYNEIDDINNKLKNPLLSNQEIKELEDNILLLTQKKYKLIEQQEKLMKNQKILELKYEREYNILHQKHNLNQIRNNQNLLNQNNNYIVQVGDMSIEEVQDPTLINYKESNQINNESEQLNKVKLKERFNETLLELKKIQEKKEKCKKEIKDIQKLINEFNQKDGIFVEGLAKFTEELNKLESKEVMFNNRLKSINDELQNIKKI